MVHVSMMAMLWYIASPFSHTRAVLLHVANRHGTLGCSSDSLMLSVGKAYPLECSLEGVKLGLDGSL